MDLVTKHGIYTEAEFRARHEIHLESYNKLINIEARTMVDMVMHQILPAALQYTSDLAESINRKRAAASLSASAENALLKKLSAVCDELYDKVDKMSADINSVPTDSEEASHYYSNVIVPHMQAVRADADLLESMTAKTYWPYPTYSDMLFY
jgi:glutamine synthetase